MFYPPKEFRRFTRILIIFALFLLLILQIFDIFPLYSEYYQYIYQVELQIVREQVMSDALMTIEYRPPSEHALAFAHLETTLPLFDQEQSLLLADPVNDTHVLVIQSESSYLAISRAAHAVVAAPNSSIDTTQIDIVRQEQDTYRSDMNLIVQLLLQHAQDMVLSIFIIQTCIIVAIVLCAIFYWVVMEKRMKHVIEGEEDHP